jgi:hypothetical protein
MTPTTIEELLDYWPGHIPFKGSLVNEDGSCMCAQGQALHFLSGLTADELRDLDQEMADKRVAELFGISFAHSVLLRIVNDGQEGAPSSVIRNPEHVLGDQAQTVLAFWRHLDRMTPAAVAAAWEAARVAARVAAWEAAREAARVAAWEAAREAAWVAAGATNEIQGATVMRAKNQPFFFLPLFGFADPEAVMRLDAAGEGEVQA